MKETQNLIKYRLERAYDTLDDAQILTEKQKWNSSINRLYYSVYYAVSALLLSADLQPSTHTGVKSNFSEYFIKTQKMDTKYGKLYSQLFTWRQKGDYDDLFDFSEEKVMPYFKPAQELIDLIENLINTGR